MSELEIWNELGNIYFNAGAHDQAIHAYQKAIDLDLGSGKSFINLVSMYMEKEFNAEAISTCQKGIELLESKSERALLWNKLGEIFLRQLEYQKALSAYQAAVDLDPENKAFMEALAQMKLDTTILEEEKNPDLETSMDATQAEDTSFQPVALSPAASEPEEVGREFTSGSDWSYEAEPSESEENNTDSGSEDEPFIESIGLQPPVNSEIEPGSEEELPLPMPTMPQQPKEKMGATVSNSVGKVPTSLYPRQAKKETHNSSPRMDEPVNIRAQALLKLGLLSWCRSDYENALQYLKTALNLAAVYFDNQFEALCLNAIARLEIDLGKPTEAIRAYENAAAFDPDNIFPWCSLGHLYSKADRYDDAVTAFKKAIAHDSQDPLSWNGLGDVYARQGRHEEAISAYQLGNIFDGSIHDEDAIAMVQMASDCEGESPRILEEMGNINFLNGAYAEAIDAFLNAIELLNNTAEAAPLWKRVGDTWQRLNNTDKASAAYQKAAELEPESEPLTQTATTIEQVSASIFPETTENTEEMDLHEAVSDYSALAQPTVEDYSTPDDSEVGEELLPAEAATDAMENEQESPVIDDSTTIEQTSTPEAATHDANPPKEAQESSDDDEDPPYWVFRTTSPAKPASRPVVPAPQGASGFKLSSAPSKGNYNASPNIVMPKLTVQPKIGTAILTDMLDDPSMLMVEERSTQPQAAMNESGMEISPSPIKAEQRLHGFGSQPAPVKDDQTKIGETSTKNPTESAAPPDAITVHNDIIAYRHVVEQNPNNDRAWDALGNMYESLGLHDEAINAFDKAISLASQREIYHYHLGLSYASQKRYDKAIQALQKVVALNPDYMLAHCALAGYYRRVGKEAEAREHVTIARPYIDHENEYNQACFESICGNIERSLDLLRKALQNGQVKMDLLQNDPDLDFIRTDPRFETLTSSNPVPAVV
jgi:tetratricopeptide (TPR) repeat protein